MPPPTTPPLDWTNNDRVNGALDVLCKKTIKNVVSSAAESKTGRIYIGSQHACPILAALEKLGHPQQPTTGSPLSTDNSTAHGILNSKMRQKVSKSFDMRYWWIKDQIKQGQFNLLWEPGELNLANYFTKHHPPWHHCQIRFKYLQKADDLKALQPVSARGCLSSTHSRSAMWNSIHTDETVRR